MSGVELKTGSIQEYFSGKTLFLTGSTGMVGTLILENLLRTCSDIKRIYVLIREKKGISVEERFRELFDNVVYDSAKRVNPNYTLKVAPVIGDNCAENLGMSSENVQKLIDEVNCVIHCSADMRFDGPIRDMVYTNVRGTRDLMRIARKMKHLQSFVYVSTAYSNCPKEEISEEIYKPPLTADELLTLVNMFEDEFLQKLSPSLIGSWPNTYVYSKCIAESAVEEEGRGLPVAIVRPSIIITTYKEPLEGWAKNLYGPIGYLMATALGLAHVFYCQKDYVVDFVPADYVANNIIVAAWSLGYQKAYKDGVENNKIKVYNCVSSPQNPLRWGFAKTFITNLREDLPTVLMYWYPFLIFASSATLYLIIDFFLQYIPAYVGDFLAACTGKRPIFVKTYKKLNKLYEVLVYFSTHQWKFFNNNTLELWNSLGEEDKQRYPFNMSLFDWKDVLYSAIRGGRVHLLNDPMDTLPKARSRLLLLKVLHYGLTTSLLFCLSVFIFFTCNLFLRLS